MHVNLFLNLLVKSSWSWLNGGRFKHPLHTHLHPVTVQELLLLNIFLHLTAHLTQTFIVGSHTYCRCSWTVNLPEGGRTGRIMTGSEVFRRSHLWLRCQTLTQVWQALHVFDQLGCVSSELISRKYASLLKFDWADHTLNVFPSHLCHYYYYYLLLSDLHMQSDVFQHLTSWMPHF